MSQRTFYYHRSFESRELNTSPGLRWAGKQTDAELFAARQMATSADECDFCHGTRLVNWANEMEAEDAEQTYSLQMCPACGWWRMRTSKALKYITGYDSASSFYSYNTALRNNHAILERFDIGSNTAPLDELNRLLLEDWRNSRHISAQRAQDLAKDIFMRHLGCEVHYYDNSVYRPDHGIDFVLVQGDNTKIAFQIKRRQADKVEPVEVVREFIGAIAESEFNHGILVSTVPLSRYAARELNTAETNLGRKGISLKVVDGSRFRDLLALHQPSDRCLEALKTLAPYSGWRANPRDPACDLPELLDRTKRLGRS